MTVGDPFAREANICVPPLSEAEAQAPSMFSKMSQSLDAHLNGVHLFVLFD